jgi:hypothetical protein
MRAKHPWGWRSSQAGFWSLIELLIVCLIIMAAVAWYLTSQQTVGAVAGGNPAAYKSTTVPGVAKERAQGVVCQNNLQQIRTAISIYQSNSGSLPPTLEDLNAGVPLKCPVGGEPYTYDPSTGQVHCTHPGHVQY